MNNSKIALDEISLQLEEVTVETEKLVERDAKLVRIIEALARIEASEEWSTLKSLIFDGEVENLEKKLRYEAEQLVVNVPQLNYLQGKLSWARKYANLQKLADSYRLELSGIRKITQPTER